MTCKDIRQYDYAAFTGQEPHDHGPPPVVLLSAEQRIGAEQMQELLSSREDAVVVDVRPRQEFDMAHIPGAQTVFAVSTMHAKTVRT